MTRLPFAQASELKALGDGAYVVATPYDWSNGHSANGGYMAAIVLKAMIAHVGDPERSPLSFSCQYLEGISEGEVTVRVATERAGRAVTAVSARVDQGGGVCINAQGSFSVRREGGLEYSTPAPAAPPPQELPLMDVWEREPPMFHRHEHRKFFGPDLFSGADEALVGGWIRLLEGEPTDEVALAMFTDAWPPSAWSRLTAAQFAPTIDITMHFRNPIPPGTTWVLARMRSTTASGSYFDEDAEFWAPDGTLLMQSRQLQLLRSRRI